MLNIAIRAARTAGNIIAKGFENQTDMQIEAKGDNYYVTRV
jgi:myo-inositol-1(or 4)-monophosphatase